MAVTSLKRNCDHLLESPEHRPVPMGAASMTFEKRSRLTLDPASVAPAYVHNSPMRSHHHHHHRSSSSSQSIFSVKEPPADIEKYLPAGKRRRLRLAGKASMSEDEGDGRPSALAPASPGACSYASLSFTFPQSAAASSSSAAAAPAAAAAAAAAPGPAAPSPSRAPREVLFTVEQVKAIVERALQDREAELSERFEAILAEKLAEQYDMFAKFNADHIHRQLSDSQWDYMI